MERLVGRTPKPYKENRRGERLQAGDQSIHPTVEVSLGDVGSDQNGESQSNPDLKDRISESQHRVEGAVDCFLRHRGSWHMERLTRVIRNF